MQILLENNTTHFQRYYPEVHNKWGKIYIETELDLEGLENGEYTLFLINDSNELVSKELVRIGDYTNNEYKTEKKFIQYGKK